MLNLPTGFRWESPFSHIQGPPAVLTLDGCWVASLGQKVDLTWFAMLYRHRSHDAQQMRACRSYETGRAGIEIWAKRHEALLREEVPIAVALQEERRQQSVQRDRLLKREAKRRRRW
ncbi:hypothetical protein [Xanthomonas euvesicatoria]|uniref:hypothetical protein n=1 Tax=Xanthomonas euvesicatoria TaxID=456327 RepID=UPI00080E06BF|nr:hypothetical protein [Xanthomonas euvesicatoria]